MDALVAAFRKEFGDRLSKTDQRYAPFSFIVQELGKLKRPVHIVETGCARQPGNWGGDGQSTVIWDWLVGQTGGTITAYDISEASVRAARSVAPRTVVQQQDSIIALRSHQNVGGIDLLYLDSFDWDGGQDSPIHHLAELASVYSSLQSGCLIAVDDCVSQDAGKGVFVEHFLSRLKVMPILRGYITVWQKP